MAGLADLFKRSRADAPDTSATNRATIDAMKAEYERVLAERTAAKRELEGLKRSKDDPSIRRADELRTKIGELQRVAERTNDYQIRKIENVFNQIKGGYDTAEGLRRAAERVATHGSDLTKDQMRQSAEGFARQLKLQAGAQAVNAAATLSTIGRVPVAGEAIQSGVGTFANASLMGASTKTAGLMGLLAASGAAIGSGVSTVMASYEEEEALRRKFGQLGGLGQGDAAIQMLRRKGVTRNEIGALGAPLAGATGGFEGLLDVYKAETAYGLGGNAVGLMGAAASTGAEGSQFKLVRDAISAGMVSGLKQGRFHEMVDGVTQLVRGATFGHTVTGEGMGGALGFMGALGGMTGFKGSQLTGLMGAFDTAIRSQQGLSGSLSFVGAYDYLKRRGTSILGGKGNLGSFLGGGPIDPLDVQELQEQGMTGAAGPDIARFRLEALRSQIGVSAADLANESDPVKAAAAKKRLAAFRSMVNQDLFGGASLSASRKLTEAYLQNPEKLDDKAIEEALKSGGGKQEQAFQDIHDQTGLQQKIAFGIEAIGRNLPGGSGGFNRMYEGMLAGASRESALSYGTPTQALAKGGVAATINDAQEQGVFSRYFGQSKRFYDNYGTYLQANLGFYALNKGASWLSDAVSGTTVNDNLSALEGRRVSAAYQGGGARSAAIQEFLKSYAGSPEASEEIKLGAAGAQQWLAAQGAASHRFTDYSASDVVGYIPGKTSTGGAPSQYTKDVAAEIMLKLLEASAKIVEDPAAVSRAHGLAPMSRDNSLVVVGQLFSTNPLIPSAQAAGK